METELHQTEQESQVKFLEMHGHFSCEAPSESSKQAGQHSNVETSLQQSQSRKQLSYHGHMQNPALTKGEKEKKKREGVLFSQRELHYCSYCCINETSISAPPYPQAQVVKLKVLQPIAVSISHKYMVWLTHSICVCRKTPSNLHKQYSSVPRASGQLQLRPQTPTVYNKSSLGLVFFPHCVTASGNPNEVYQQFWSPHASMNYVHRSWLLRNHIPDSSTYSFTG